MNLGYDAKRLFNNATGLGNYSRTLLHNLQAYYPEDTYCLYTPDQGDLPAALPFKSSPYRMVVPTGPINPLWRSRGVIKNLVADQIKIYHGLSHQIPSGLSREDIKSVVTIHDLIIKRYPNTYSAIDRGLYEMKLRHSLANADAIVAISEHTKQDILTYFPSTPAEKIHVIYQACDPIFYEATPTDEEISQTRQELSVPEDYLLYVGSFLPRKNLLNLLRAYHQSHVDLPLVMIGRGKRYFRRMQKLIDKLGITRRITFLQNLKDNRQLRHLYLGARAFVYPSWFEGFGLPVAEALLSSVPILTSNSSSLPETAGPAALLVNPHSVDELASGLTRVLEIDAEKVTEMGHQHAMKHFSPEPTAQQMMTLYRQLTS